jgi:methylated-DNA-[protein]-cysteine S-methyltransferase
MTTFSEKVLELTSKIPKCKVTTYSEIARALGKPGASRAVGNALRHNTHPDSIPCYKVVKSDGSLGGYSGKMDSPEKARRLRKDGVAIRDGKVDMRERFHSFGRRK